MWNKGNIKKLKNIFYPLLFSKNGTFLNVKHLSLRIKHIYCHEKNITFTFFYATVHNIVCTEPRKKQGQHNIQRLPI